MTYSVFSSKLRIHNISCLKAECSGFLEVADDCKAKCCAIICKSSDYFINFLAWLNTGIAIGLMVRHAASGHGAATGGAQVAGRRGDETRKGGAHTTHTMRARANPPTPIPHPHSDADTPEPRSCWSP